MKNTSVRAAALVIALVVSQALAAADGAIVRSEKHAFSVRILAQGLDHPWSMAWLPDGRMLVTERAGRLRIVSKDFRLEPDDVEGLPWIFINYQGGLFEVAVHPRYNENGWIYISYNGLGELGYGTELLRARLDGTRLTSTQVLFRMAPKSQSDVHFGGRIVFDGKGHVFLTLGDRGVAKRSQRLDDHAGSVIRLNEDGSVPRDNPFVNRKDARPEKFSYGSRNIQGAAIHPKTGELWTHEHGPKGGDEINVIRAGRNYGWPVITHGVSSRFNMKIGEGTHKAGMEPPLYQWTPAIAPSGMAFYEGNRFPGWRGSLLVGALAGAMLVRLELDGEKVVKEERMLKGTLGRIRDVRVGPDGYVYLLTDDKRGVLARLEPATP